MKLKIHDYEICYEVKGNPEALETVVFLNGVMASISSWHHQVKALEHEYRIILHDFKGQLLSGKPEGPYTFAEHAADLLALLDHLKVDRAHLIGTSYGGEVGMKFASLYPERVKTLSVIASVSELDDLLKAHVSSWKLLASQAKNYETKKTFFEVMCTSIYSSAFFRDNREMLSERAEAAAKMDDSYFQGQVTLYNTFLNDVTMTKELDKISCPTLIIAGEEDHLKPVKFSKIMHDHIKNSELFIIPGGGHVLIFEKPKELNTLLIGFLKKHQ